MKQDLPPVCRETLEKSYRKERSDGTRLSDIPAVYATLGTEREAVVGNAEAMMWRTGKTFGKMQRQIGDICDIMAVRTLDLANRNLPARATIFALSTSGLVTRQMQSFVGRTIFPKNTPYADHADAPEERDTIVLTKLLAKLTGQDFRRLQDTPNIGDQSVLEAIALASIVKNSTFFTPKPVFQGPEFTLPQLPTPTFIKPGFPRDQPALPAFTLPKLNQAEFAASVAKLATPPKLTQWADMSAADQVGTIARILKVIGKRDPQRMDAIVKAALDPQKPASRKLAKAAGRRSGKPSGTAEPG